MKRYRLYFYTQIIEGNERVTLTVFNVLILPPCIYFNLFEINLSLIKIGPDKLVWG